MNDWIVCIPSQMPHHSSILPYVFVNGDPHVFITKTKKQPITRTGGDTLKGPTFFLITTY